MLCATVIGHVSRRRGDLQAGWQYAMTVAGGTFRVSKAIYELHLLLPLAQLNHLMFIPCLQQCTMNEYFHFILCFPGQPRRLGAL
jgi:hypothetical protein